MEAIKDPRTVKNKDRKATQWWNPSTRWSPAFPKRSILWLGLILVLLWIGIDISGRLYWHSLRKTWEKQGIVIDAAYHARDVPQEDDFLEAPVVKRWIEREQAVTRAVGFPGARIDPQIVQNEWDYEEEESFARQILKTFAAYETILAEIREAAARPEVSRPGSKSLREGGGLPVNCMGFAEARTLRARALLRVGRSEEAANELIVGVRVAEHLGNLGAPPSNLIRAGSLSVLERGFRDGLQRRAWDANQLRDLAEAIDRIHLTKRYAEATVIELSHPGMNRSLIQGESESRSQNFRNAGKALLDLKEASKPLDQWGEAIGYTLVALSPKGLWDWQWARTCSVVVENLVLERAEIFPELTVEQVEKFEKASKELGNSPYPPNAFAPGDILDTRQHYDLIRLAIALEQYALENDGYPERLEELVPDWITAIPASRFDPTRPIRYERSFENRYRLVAADDYAFVAEREIEEVVLRVERVVGDLAQAHQVTIIQFESNHESAEGGSAPTIMIRGEADTMAAALQLKASLAKSADLKGWQHEAPQPVADGDSVKFSYVLTKAISR